MADIINTAKKLKEMQEGVVTGGPYSIGRNASLKTVSTAPALTGKKILAAGETEQQTPAAQPTAKPAGYTVGAGYTPDTSLYADKKDKNAITAQQYDKQLSAYQAALQAAYDNQAAANRLEAQKLKNEFDASRSNVYTNSRLSAIGNNERLAALGLAGNVYDYARSGTSETSRIGQDIAMRKSLAGLDQSENEARSDLAMQLLSAQREAEANYANKVAEVEAAKIPYLTALAKSTSSGGGGGGSSGGTSTKKSSGSSDGTGGGNGSNITGEQIFNSVNAEAKYSSRDALNKMVDPEYQSKLKSAGVSQAAINDAIKRATEQYSKNTAANLKKDSDSSETNKYSSRYIG